MRWRREEYLDLMTFGHAPRPMFCELFGPLVGLEDEWRRQGATAQQLDLTAFDWDYVPIVGVGANTWLRNGHTPVVIEETDTHRIERDALGRTMKLIKQSATIALPQNYPVATMDDWQRIRPHFTFHEDRIDWQFVEQAKAQQAQGALVVAHIPGGFDAPRQLMGEAGACLAYYEDPEMMHDMIRTFSDTAFEVYRRVSETITIDQLSVHEDLAGKSGPLVGPAQIKTFIAPYFKRIADLLLACGTRLFDMDTDGNVNAVLDALLDTGLNSMHPMEPAAGMDIVALRQRYGKRLVMRGGIDKHVLRQGHDAIDRELQYKLQPTMRDGDGIAFGLDHRIPNGTPLEAYCYYVQRGREMLGLPPLEEDVRGWRRMAF